MSRLKLRIDPDATITAIWDDSLADLAEQGQAKIERVSNVEPDSSGKWIVQMTNGVRMGPYKLRAHALAAEVDYLTQGLFQCAE